MKRLLTAILAMILVLSMCACANSGTGEEPDDKTSKPSGDELVTVFQKTCMTEYEADGSKGTFQQWYTYDDMGNLLAIETDRGMDSEVWDEDQNIYKYITGPFDGSINYSRYFLYTKEGHIRYDGSFTGPVTENGKLIDGLEVSSDVYYTYRADGQIDTMERYRITVDGIAYDEPTISYKCSYNKNKQLISVICTTPVQEDEDNYHHLCEWFYDDQGRMIEERYYLLEGTRSYRYTYNDNGLLAKAEYGYVNVDIYGNLRADEEKFSPLWGIKTFAYDDQGNLIDPENNTIQYDEKGRLIAFDEYTTITYLADGGKEINNQGDVYLFDAHGNLIRHTEANGKYVLIEYRSIRVTKTEAKRLERFQLLRLSGAHYDSRSSVYEYMSTIKVPDIPLHEYEVLLRRGYKY